MDTQSYVVVHSKPSCPYCEYAKDFLKKKRLPFTEVVYDPTREEYEIKKNDLISRTNHRTFPQIFVGDRFIGGYQDMTLLYATQKFHEIYQSELGIVLERDDDF